MATSDSLSAASKALLLEVLRESRTRPDVVPEGWFHWKQLLVAWNKKARSQVSRTLAKVPHEVKMFRVYCGKRVQAVPHYRFPR